MIIRLKIREDGSGKYILIIGEKEYLTSDELETIGDDLFILKSINPTYEEENMIIEQYNYINSIFIEGGVLTEEEIKKKKSYIIREFKSDIASITNNYCQEEIDTFTIKEIEAEKVLNGGTSTFLEGICIEGETVEDLANKIIDNANNYKQLYSTAEKKMREAINNLES